MSKAWDLRGLQQSFSQNKIVPSYTLVGEDSYLIQEALDSVKAHFLKLGVNFDFNFENIFASENKTAHVIDLIETFPMMSPYRLVILRESQLLKEKDWDLFQGAFKKGLAQTVVVFVFDSKIDKRKKIFKWLTSNTQIVELQPPYDNQIPQWIHYIAERNSIKLDQGAAIQLLYLVGANLSELSNEIIKLKTYYDQETKSLSSDDILKVVSKKRIDSIFDLTNAVGLGDKAASLHFLERLLEQGQNEVAILSLITRHMRILKKLLEGQAMGMNQKQLSTKVGVSPFFLKDYITQSQKWNVNKLDKLFDLLMDTDKALKSSPVSSKIWLENFIIQTCAMRSGYLEEVTI